MKARHFALVFAKKKLSYTKNLFLLSEEWKEMKNHDFSKNSAGSGFGGKRVVKCFGISFFFPVQSAE